MRVAAGSSLGLLAALTGLLVGATSPVAAAATRRTHAQGRSAAAGARLKGIGARVAVQPFEGPNTEPLRGLVARIVRGRGLRPMTTLPRYDGTGQYPSLARDHTLAAFVTADLEERGGWQRLTFLVWSGSSGAVVGRWTASARSTALARAVGKGFWPHLGPALMKAQAPAPAIFAPAPPMRIDASAAFDDAHVAARE